MRAKLIALFGVIIGLCLTLSALSQNFQVITWTNYAVTCVAFSNSIPTTISADKPNRVCIYVYNNAANQVCIGQYAATNGVSNVVLFAQGNLFKIEPPMVYLGKIVGINKADATAVVNVLEGLGP